MEHIFSCFEKLGFKLSVDKCGFGIRKVYFLCHTITEHGIAPNNKKIEQFLKAVWMPKTLKQVRRLIGFMQLYAKFIPNLSVKLQPFLSCWEKRMT